MHSTPTVDTIPLETRVKIIAEAAAYANERYMERCWIENDAEGFTGWRWDKHNVIPYIVCAANRYKDFIVTGSRHLSAPMWMTIELVGMDALHAYAGGRDNEEQGFIDQFGTYWNRRDAYAHCVKHGRLLLEDGASKTQLFSEHLF
ncbi:hypothetical protein MZD04_gp273 [Pseudomonas phage Psa21]|uniref:Uncharacterized protein n=1 Tax=Pseudomonas phage Psa21 TaxID=2530023 RepID=A0A481W4M1_9CAUD|nr:hypothetical protein MZD04_gp273 [Pseudomonas phage Psa21]QBJ02799.1 hypothetical protein PSA21_273 [Pseudomonas phage Psa21]